MTERTSPARPPQEAGARSTPAAKVFAVAWREFKHTALTKAFLFGAVILPLVI
jgi:hypothetical protein